MSGEVDAETAAYVEALRRNLPAAVAAHRAKEVAYFGSEDEVPDVRDLVLRVVVRDDGLPKLVIDCTIHDGDQPPSARARFRLDAEWRRSQDATQPGGYVDAIAFGLVVGGAYETPEQDPTTEELAAVDAALPDAATLWADLPRLAGGRWEGDRLVVNRATVLVTPEQWREHVVDWEVAARRDRGVDAMRPGQGHAYAAADLEETVASTGASFVVWWRGEPHASSRAELPPV